MSVRRNAALREVGRLLVSIVNAVVTMIIIALPVLIRLSCILCGVIGVALGLLPVWEAYGGDVPALIPAVVFCFAPTTYALINRLSFGGVLAGGFAAYAIGMLMPLLSVELRSFLVVSIIGAACVAQLSHDKELQNVDSVAD